MKNHSPLRLTIRLKFILGFGIVAFVPLVVMIGIYFNTLNTLLEDSAERELLVGAEQTSQKLDTFFQETLANLRSQSQLSDFAAYIAEQDEALRQQTSPRISAIFRSLGRSTNQAYVQTYLLLDAKGRVVFDQTLLDIGKDFSTGQYFSLPWQHGRPFVTIVHSDNTGRHVIYFSTPIWDDHGTRIGVLALRYNGTVVQSLASKSINMGGVGSFPIVTDSDGHVLAWGNDPNPISRFIPPELLKVDTYARQRVLEGEPYALAHQYLASVRLHVFYVQPEWAITRYVLSHAFVILLIIVGIVILTILSAYVMGQVLSRPINALKQTAEALSQGNFDARVEIQSKDEIGVLGQTFNKMAEEIQAELREIRAAEERYRDLSLSLEQKVNQRTEQLQNANKELESFSYSVSHDLRAPLRAIDGYSRILQEYTAQLDDEAQAYLARIRAASMQMNQLIEGLLSFSRLERQAMHVELISSPALRRMLNEIIDTLQSSSPERVIHWQVGDLPPCYADPTLLRQVFTNLLGNAFKYTQNKEAAVIEVGYNSEAYFVRDNGAGFNMAYADKLFGVFQRLHRPDEFEGTGVGLATVKRIIERHGGSIWAKAEVDKGAAFYFTLPGDASQIPVL